MLSLAMFPVLLAALFAPAPRGVQEEPETMTFSAATQMQSELLIERLPTIRVPSAIERNNAGRFGVAEADTMLFTALLYRCRKDELKGDAWDHLVRLCIENLGDGPSYDWVARYKPFIREARKHGRVPREWADLLGSQFRVVVQSRACWPKDEPVAVLPSLLTAVDPGDWVIDRASSNPELAWEDSFQYWDDGVVFVNQTAPGVASAVIDLKNRKDGSATSVRHSVQVCLTESESEIIESVQDEEVQSWVENMPMVALRESESVAHVLIPISELSAIPVDRPEVTLALEFRLQSGDAVLASGVAWWSSVLDPDVLPEIVHRLTPIGTRVVLRTTSDVKLPDDRSTLKLHIDSSRRVALRDFNHSKMYDIHVVRDVVLQPK